MGNEAYDFERFERTPYKKAEKVAQPPELKVVKSRQKKESDNSFAVYLTLMFITALFIISAVIYNNVRLTELTSKYQNIQQEYKTLEEEGNRMRVELEEKVSLRTVEDKATNELKMAKAEEYQIEYVNLGSESKIVKTIKPKESVSTNIGSVWLKVLEYIKS